MPPAWATFLDLLHPIIWISWVLYWQVSAIGVKPIARYETAWGRLVHLGPLVVAVTLLCNPFLVPALAPHIIPWTSAGYWIGTAVLVAGLGFATWARVILGRNWSATVAVKEGHELIRTGPYALVRHPIYTGMLAGFLGSAISLDRWCGVAAFLLVAVAFWFKLLREEKLMRETFGEAYATYARGTRRLIPFVL